ncbi:unnamed protein product [Periconia digitata]|uniref:Uncharacterized protein n=1 Tax=Periconia digitata TaxID=1303443 RepID=A0A9W4UC33_9PLEO|nr:unnamed protein product [Periconia digitata]
MACKGTTEATAKIGFLTTPPTLHTFPSTKLPAAGALLRLPSIDGVRGCSCRMMPDQPRSSSHIPILVCLNSDSDVAWNHRGGRGKEATDVTYSSCMSF